VFEGFPVPLNIVFGMDAAVLPAAFGLTLASALAIGKQAISATEITFKSSDFPLISIDGDSSLVG
jgi:hypothetical protein